MKIINLMVDVNMGLGHPGLIALAERLGVKAQDLKDGELLMFLNRDRSKLKILGKQGLVMGYLRLPKHQKIMLEAIQYLPATFGGGGFSYATALKQALVARLASEQAKKTRPQSVYSAEAA